MLTLKEHQERYLTNKSESQLTMHILAVKKEMNHLKRAIEGERLGDFRASHSGELAQIQKLRLYLRDTSVALEQIGGTFRHSEADKRAMAFQQNIPFIQRIDYSIGGYLGGFDHCRALVEENQVFINFKPPLSDTSIRAYTKIPADSYDYKMDKRTFLKTIESLHMGEWRGDYLASDYGFTIIDGSSWMIEVYYSNDSEKVEFSGHNAYPYNFDVFHKLFNP